MMQSFRKVPAALLVLALSAALLAACTASAAQNPTPVLDDRLFGQWSSQADPSAISLDSAGQPIGTVPIGIWFLFHENGMYERVANFMTFAIGGVSVEEGRYAVKGDQLVLTARLDSFFPFEGSPQQKHYRTSEADSSLSFRFGTEDGAVVLYLAETNSAEVLFHFVK